MGEAKKIYLKNYVNTGDPNFIQVKCDPINCADDTAKGNPTTKTEAKDESAPSEDSTIGNVGPRDCEEFNNDSNDRHFDAGGECKGGKVTSTASDPPKTTKKSRKKSSTKFNHVIADYIDMACEVCKHPFQSLPEARGHLRSKHKLWSIHLKCCQRRVALYDINGHIQSHSNPEIYK